MSHKIPSLALLFLIYTADIGKIAQHHHVSLYLYADDNRVYTHGRPDQDNVLWDKTSRCME